MDPRIRKIAVLCSVVMILLAAGLVFLLDAQNGGSGNGKQNGIKNENGNSGNSDTGNTTDQVGNDLKAFLQDDNFFDPEVNTALENALNRTRKLSLLVTSVEKDIRVQIVDPDGKPVSGISFLVKVEGLGEFKDLDQDGILYIGGLSAREYNVELEPVEGYVVPNEPTRIRVKEKVEYLAIEDISALIKTEKDIDAAKEDTGTKNAVSDADKTEIKDLQKTTGATKLGIDVSKWNGEIDWDKVKKAGIDFTIVRVGYRGSVTGAIVVDPNFTANMTGASGSLVQKGVYFFTQAVNEVEAVEEASAVLELIRNYKLDYPVFIDTEGAGGEGRADSLDKETRTLVCEAFCRTIENAGYQAGVYASRYWFNNNLYADRLSKYRIWLAEYRDVPLYQGYYNMWQYTSKGSVDGIAGNVDLDISYE